MKTATARDEPGGDRGQDPRPREEAFNMRFQHVSGQLTSPIRLRRRTRDIPGAHRPARARAGCGPWQGEEGMAAQKRGRASRGPVVKANNHKTRVVVVDQSEPHQLYGRVLRRTTKLVAHDEKNESHVGDVVRIEECRPLAAPSGGAGRNRGAEASREAMIQEYTNVKMADNAGARRPGASASSAARQALRQRRGHHHRGHPRRHPQRPSRRARWPRPWWCAPRRNTGVPTAGTSASGRERGGPGQ